MTLIIHKEDAYLLSLAVFTAIYAGFGRLRAIPNSK